MNCFIDALKKSPYFTKYIINDIDINNIIGIYIAGSTCLGIEDEYSDYDIIVLTLKPVPDSTDFKEFVRLKYKGRPAHWYYRPIEDIFSLKDVTDLDVLCKVQFDFFFRTKTIYENFNHIDLLLALDALKSKISTIASYAFLKANLAKINKLVTQNCILKKDHSKHIYHWCIASCYLTKTPLNIDCLRELKRIYWSPVKSDYKKWAIQILKQGVKFINTNSWNCEKELNNLYDEIYK